MPTLDEGLGRIPVIGQILGIAGLLGGRGSSGPSRRDLSESAADRLRRMLDQVLPPETPLPPQGPIIDVSQPPYTIPAVGTTTPDTTSSGTTGPEPPATSSGETDRERRRRERREARAQANRRTNVSILGAFQTGLGVLSQLGSLRSTLRPPTASSSLALPSLGSLGMLGRPFPSNPPVPYNPPVAPGGVIRGGGFRTGTGAAMPLAGPPPGYHWAKDGSGKIVKNRHMNVLNPRAAKRAIRRIKGARKMLRSIESSLPKRAVARSASPFKRKR